MPVALVSLPCTYGASEAQDGLRRRNDSVALHAGVFDVQRRSFSREHMDIIDEHLYKAFPPLIGPNEVHQSLWLS
jgi:hypothetical protein